VESKPRALTQIPKHFEHKVNKSSVDNKHQNIIYKGIVLSKGFVQPYFYIPKPMLLAIPSIGKAIKTQVLKLV
jgi:hypothetical protein